jgi:hypothetical protein
MANNTRRLGGISSVTIDGVQYLTIGDIEYSASTVKRETLSGVDAVHGYSEMPVAGFISMNLRDAGDLTVADFNAMTSSNVQATLANGKGVLVSGGWTTDVQEIATETGSFKVRFDSDTVIELTA